MFSCSDVCEQCLNVCVDILRNNIKHIKINGIESHILEDTIVNKDGYECVNWLRENVVSVFDRFVVQSLLAGALINKHTSCFSFLNEYGYLELYLSQSENYQTNFEILLIKGMINDMFCYGIVDGKKVYSLTRMMLVLYDMTIFEMYFMTMMRVDDGNVNSFVSKFVVGVPWIDYVSNFDMISHFMKMISCSMKDMCTSLLESNVYNREYVYEGCKSMLRSEDLFELREML